jgi:uncharacterized protein YdeI (YjbR/CyaY-like superfamily)
VQRTAIKTTNARLHAALAALPAAEQEFHALAPSHRRAFFDWIDEAGARERDHRIASIVTMLAAPN